MRRPGAQTIGFIVKHLPCTVDPETALHSKRMLQPQGGWLARNPAISRKPTMKPQRFRSVYRVNWKSKL